VTGGRQALAALICAALFVTAFASAAAAVDTAKRPPAVKLFINGKRYIGGPLPHGTDNYVPINAGKLAVVAKWPTNLRGTGYQIELATTEPVERVQAVCKTGTSCRVTRTIRIKRAVEMSWKVTIYSKVGFPVGGFVVCLVGRT
jgi:hypothetical protein